MSASLRYTAAVSILFQKIKLNINFITAWVSHDKSNFLLLNISYIN